MHEPGMRDAKASLVEEQEAAAILVKEHKHASNFGRQAAGWRAYQKVNRKWFYRNTDVKRFK